VAALCLAALVFPWLRKGDTRARIGAVAVSIILALNYIAWRIHNTLPDWDVALDLLAGLVFLGVELIETIRSIVFLVFMSRTRERSPEVEANLGWLASLETPPLVDVLICTYDEEEAILERTIVGAMAMEYPNFRLWVLDDGRRPWLAKLCERGGCGYLTRANNAHAKAGNINNGLRHLASLKSKPEFVSILDADFVCTPAFLTRAMSLFRDESVGVVQTPQHFSNSDPIQSNLAASKVWPDEQRLFFDVIMPAKDAWGLAICCGTSSVIRAQPLYSIGGFPTDSVTEDYLVTLRLKEIGFRTIYLNEPLTSGLAPEGLKEYITQRGRWCLGLVQIVRGRSGPFAHNSLPLIDRIALFEAFFGWTSTNVFRITGFVAPPLFLLLGVKAVNADIDELMTYFLPYFLWHTATMTWISAGRVLPIMSDVCQLASCPAIIKAAAIGLINPRNQRFKVTAKGGDRNRRFVEWPLLRIFLAMLAMTAAGMISYNTGTSYDVGGSGALAYGWSWYNVIVLVIACVVCIEQPRKRKSERYASDEPILIASGARSLSRSIIDISIGGSRISGPSPARAGETIRVFFAGLEMNATIVRIDADDFAVAFEPTFTNRAAMIRRIHSGRYTTPFEDVQATAVGAAILKRIFG
jgi:cellulose synthase (UDP-forming)